MRDHARWIVPAGRVMMALLFGISGLVKLTASAAMAKYMIAYGVPGVLLWPAAAWELAAAVLLVAGLWLRPLSLLLAGWCLLTALIFHTALGDPAQLMNFLKNVTMAGAFLIFAATGLPGWGLPGWAPRSRP